MLGYNPRKSAVTKIEFLGIVLIFSIFLMSFIYDRLLCITGFNWLSKNSETFSVRVMLFEINGLPGTFSKRLLNLSYKYSLPEFVAFLNSVVKYLSSFSVRLPFVLILLNSLLLLYGNSWKILSLKLISL